VKGTQGHGIKNFFNQDLTEKERERLKGESVWGKKMTILNLD